jgi:hypothetical protein
MKYLIIIICLFAFGCGHSSSYYQKQLDELETNERALHQKSDKLAKEVQKMKDEESDLFQKFPVCPRDIPPYHNSDEGSDIK